MAACPGSTQRFNIMKESSFPGSALTEECLQHFQKGSNLAYITIVCHFSKPLGSFVSRFTGNATATAEIVEDSFNKLWLRHEIMCTAAGIEAFLFTVARHGCLLYQQQYNHH